MGIVKKITFFVTLFIGVVFIVLFIFTLPYGENIIRSTIENKIARGYYLSQNYPNPFNPETTIKFQIPKASVITLKIYNINGQEIKTLTNREYQPGNYSVKWDGTDMSGNKVASGIYIYFLKTNTGYVESKKMLLVK